jgi:hypothetical protein
MRTHSYVRVAVLLVSAALPWTASAQDAPQPAVSTASPIPAQIDETIVNLPTTLPLKAHGSYFRLTHRFARDLRRGSFGDLAQDLFSLDNGAIIGLEYRYGITRTLQAGVHRSIFNKAIVAFGRWDAWAQTDSRPYALSFGGGLEGNNNLRQDYQPAVSATVSHTHGDRLAVYATPTYVHKAHTDTLLELHEGHQHDTPELEGGGDARDTFFLGLGARVRVRPTAYIVFEASPRLAGYKPDGAAWNAGIEKMTHGHVLQLNFGNNFDTTPGELARGGDKQSVFMGFNISRKFW